MKASRLQRTGFMISGRGRGSLQGPLRVQLQVQVRTRRGVRLTTDKSFQQTHARRPPASDLAPGAPACI
eukprot:scaffold126812_cov27-Tisochrysis_lutea.AAC.3